MVRRELAEGDGGNDCPCIPTCTSLNGVSTVISKEDKDSALRPVDPQVQREDIKFFKASVEKTEIEVADGMAERSESDRKIPGVSPANSSTSSASSTPGGDAKGDDNCDTSRKVI